MATWIRERVFQAEETAWAKALGQHPAKEPWETSVVGPQGAQERLAENKTKKQQSLDQGAFVSQYKDGLFSI